MSSLTKFVRNNKDFCECSHARLINVILHKIENLDTVDIEVGAILLRHLERVFAVSRLFGYNGSVHLVGL